MSLVLVSAAGDRRFPIDDTIVMTVGREVTCDIPILDHIVSRRHAELYSVPDGVSVEDKGSRNGTWVTGQRLQPGRAWHCTMAELPIVVYLGGSFSMTIRCERQS